MSCQLTPITSSSSSSHVTAPNGTLSDQIKKVKFLSEEKSKYWFKQCASALHYMHTLNPPVCHRDIKVENVLLDANMDAKLSDFGFAREIDLSGPLSRTHCGTEPYFCPELIKKESYNPLLADTWAMGVMLFAMINGKFPFHFKDLKRNKEIMLNEQKTGAYKFRPEQEGVSPPLKDLIRHLLDPNVQTRFNSLGMIRHPWLN